MWNTNEASITAGHRSRIHAKRDGQIDFWKIQIDIPSRKDSQTGVSVVLLAFGTVEKIRN
jgi:hypothetical protein